MKDYRGLQLLAGAAVVIIIAGFFMIKSHEEVRKTEERAAVAFLQQPAETTAAAETTVAAAEAAAPAAIIPDTIIAPQDEAEVQTETAAVAPEAVPAEEAPYVSPINFEEYERQAASDRHCEKGSVAGYLKLGEISEPVMKAGSDDEYYLHHAIDGSSGSAIYVKSENPERSVLLFGHNNKNLTRFGLVKTEYANDLSMVDGNSVFYLPNGEIELTPMCSIFVKNKTLEENFNASKIFDLRCAEDVKAFASTGEILDGNVAEEDASYYVVIQTCDTKRGGKVYVIFTAE